MMTVIPPSEGVPHEGDATLWSEQRFSGAAQPSPSMLVATELMSDWHTIWTGCPSATLIVRFCQACQSTRIGLVVPAGAPVKSRVTVPRGPGPCTASTVQSTVVALVEFWTDVEIVRMVWWVASVPRAAVGSAAMMPMMDKVVSQPALRSRRAATARQAPTMSRHTPPPMTMMRATVWSGVAPVMKGIVGPLSTR